LGTARELGPQLRLPVIPHDSADRVATLERIAADLVGQLGSDGGRFLAALLDEQAAEADGR